MLSYIVSLFTGLPFLFLKLLKERKKTNDRDIMYYAKVVLWFRAKLLLQEAVTLSYYDRSRDRSAKNLVVVGVPNIEHDAVLVASPT